MRWEGQRAGADPQAVLPGLTDLVRSVRPPEFHGVTFHEVRAHSVLNRVPGESVVPFRWTVNPYRGCSHSCVYCFARNTHTYLDFDAGKDFDTQVVVKINAPEVLAAQLRKPGWTREHVAMGTNTDPYQRAEGRYRLMPGIIRALAGSGTPFSILTKGTLLKRDLPLLRSVAGEVDVGLGVSIAVLDGELHRSVEPGTPGPQARLDLVRRVREAGLPCGVMIAPVLPGLTDSPEDLDALLAAVAEAGATSATVLPLHLRPGAREWYAQWLAETHPGLVPRYQELYGRGSYADGRYRRLLAARVAPLVRRHGFDRTGSEAAHRPSRPHSADHTAEGPRPPAGEQLRLL
jgi:DNA repair photolyase